MEAVQGIEDFINYVVATLAGRPESAQITRREVGIKHIFDVKVDDEDVPRLLGRSGNTVTALRNLAIAAAERDGLDVGLEVVEEGNFRHRDDDRDLRGDGRSQQPGRRQRRF